MDHEDAFQQYPQYAPDVVEYATPMLDRYVKKSDSTNIFRISKQDLALFFSRRNMAVPDNTGECRTSLNILRECGYSEGLCQLLNTDSETGIVGDAADLKRRQTIFGKHKIKMPKIESFVGLLARQFEDANVIVLIWAATAYLFVSLFSSNRTAFVESLTIYCGLLFAGLISALCDWIKERQNLALKQVINAQEVAVYRGQYGTVTSVPISSLVVGDIVDLSQGDRVPADCILIEEMNITVDQSFYEPAAANSNILNTDPLLLNYVAKEQSSYYGADGGQEDNHLANPDPFLLTESKIMTGQGKAIICAVGSNTLLSRMRGGREIKIEEQQTHLENKLNVVAEQVGKYALAVAGVSVLTHLVFLVLFLLFDQQALFSNATVLKCTEILIIAIVILIVAIPEGLPLAVSLAMALSTDKLKKDSILIKNMEAVQKCAIVHDICVGKTGTLTQGKMNVAKYQLCDYAQAHDHLRDEPELVDAFKTRLEVPEELKDLIIESIIANTDVRIEIAENKIEFSDDEDELGNKREPEHEYLYEPRGQELEVGLIKFLFDVKEDVPARFIERNRTAPKLTQLPFDQILKRKTVARQVVGNPELVRVYTKGAPEYIVDLCDKTLDENMDLVDFTQKVEILEDIIGEDMASKHCLKVVSFAYKEITMKALNELMHQHPLESAEFRQELESDLVYLTTFGLDDPLRDDIADSVQLIRYGRVVHGDTDGVDSQVNIRLVTGDHIQTAKQVAIKTGIITEAEAKMPGTCITGAEFLERIQGYDTVRDVNSGQFAVKFHNPAAFNELKKKVKVIARSTAENKFVLVSGIKQKGGLVAMTGNSISDAQALRKADVGLAMGTGCDVAKDNADLVILDNNFASIHRAILWGRQTFDNVRKFLQFQVTVNIVICIITVLGGATIGQIPLNVVQMLWTNLIMDVLGAIALGTEPPSQDRSGECSSRISRGEKIMLPVMWRQILVQAAYQLLVMVTLMYFGTFMFFTETFNIVTEDRRDLETGIATSRLVLNTIMFYTFILMNLFNQFNCRILDADEINMFKGVQTNPLFWIVTLLEFFITILMVRAGSSRLGSAVLGTAALTTGQIIVCWVLGAMSLVVHVASKRLPMKPFLKFSKIVDLEAEKKNEMVNTFMAAAESQFKTQIESFLEPQEEEKAANAADDDYQYNDWAQEQ